MDRRSETISEWPLSGLSPSSTRERVCEMTGAARSLIYHDGARWSTFLEAEALALALARSGRRTFWRGGLGTNLGQTGLTLARLHQPSSLQTLQTLDSFSHLRLSLH